MAPSASARGTSSFSPIQFSSSSSSLKSSAHVRAQGDDHHWVEFYDPSSPGPFNNSWHTKEGTSGGNRGGPWDSPSGPMNRCLRYLNPKDDLNTMWVSAWSSRQYMPLQWTGGEMQRRWGFVGGQNVCGAYCSAWGCGQNQTDRWTQEQCGPANAS